MDGRGRRGRKFAQPSLAHKHDLAVARGRAFWRLAMHRAEALASMSARELAGNSYYEFARAFRNNDLDYHTFYITMPERAAAGNAR